MLSKKQTNSMEFKKTKAVHTDDLWYDIFEGGYIKPEKLLKNKEDIEKVNNAIKTLLEFRQKAEEQNLIKYT